jgi:hypothetical protein
MSRYAENGREQPVQDRRISLESPVEAKIARAESVHGEAGPGLRERRDIRRLLQRFEAAAGDSRRVMLESGIVDICRDCDEYEGGSCCGKGMENRYSWTLLLINLLLDRPLPHSRLDPSGCFFLGPSGCVLKARHVICVNYLCSRIIRSIPEQQIFRLRDCEGEELNTLFLLEEKVKRAVSG